MRNIIFILSLFLLSLTANAQTIVPLDKAKDYMPLPRTVYVKDVNSVLDKYVGFWEGEYKNKTYQLDIEKIESLPSIAFETMTFDALLIRFKIKDNSTGVELYNTLNMSINDNIIKSSPNLKEMNENRYACVYHSPNRSQSRCGDFGDMFIDFINPLKLEVYVERGFYVNYIYDGVNNCPNGSVYPPFPKEKADALVLTKVTSQPGLGN